MLRLKDLRKQKKISQTELAKILGVAQPTLSGWESGKFQIDDTNKIKLADFFNVSVDYLLGRDVGQEIISQSGIQVMPPYREVTIGGSKHVVDLTNIAAVKGISIPVLGSVPAGIPLEAITDVLDYEEISPALAARGEYFALKIKGNSMAPRICDGDVVIVKKESAIDNGDVAIIMVNGNEATCKEVQFSKAGITLVGWNVTEFQPIFYTKEDVETLPVRIVGRVVEVRIKSLKRGKF